MKIIVLLHKDLIPPDKVSAAELAWADWKTEYTVIQSLKKNGNEVKIVGLDHDLQALDQAIDEFQPSIIFNLLEEFQDEAVFDQHVVSYLELKGIPYTGCSPRGLTLSRDKAVTKLMLQHEGILTPQFCVVPKGNGVSRTFDLKFPVIVKSLIEEASLGISQSSVVTNIEKLEERVQFIHEQIGTDALVEEYIEGRELYVGLLGNKNLKVLPPWELYMNELNKSGYAIATRNVKFSKDYCSKHNITRGLAKNISPQIQKKIERVCKKAVRSLGLNGYMRVDLRLTDEGDIYIIEVNPNAELAKGEDLANAAQAAGLNYDALVEKVVQLGYAWNRVA